MRKVKTHAFAYFHKRTRAPLLACLSKQLHFAMYTIRKEMVYSKLLSFSIMRKLRNCVSPLNVKIVRKYFAVAAFFKLSSVLTNPLKS